MYQYDIWYMSLCIGDRLVCQVDVTIQSDIRGLLEKYPTVFFYANT